MEKEDLYPEHETMIREAKEHDRVLCRLVKSKPFLMMDRFMRNLGSPDMIRIVNNLDLTDPKQFNILKQYEKIRRVVIRDFKKSITIYVKYENGVN